MGVIIVIQQTHYPISYTHVQNIKLVLQIVYTGRHENVASHFPLRFYSHTVVDFYLLFTFYNSRFRVYLLPTRFKSFKSRQNTMQMMIMKKVNEKILPNCRTSILVSLTLCSSFRCYRNHIYAIYFNVFVSLKNGQTSNGKNVVR